MEPDWRKELQERTELTSEQIQEEIENKKQEYPGLLTEESATILVARSHGVNLIDKLKQEPLTLDIENIVPGMRSVNVTGHVTEIQDEYNPSDKDFRVRNVEIEDDTGKTTVAFWNEDSDQAEKLRTGHRIMIEDGYTKDNPSEYQLDRYSVPGVSIGGSTKVTVYNNEGESIVLIEP